MNQLRGGHFPASGAFPAWLMAGAIGVNPRESLWAKFAKEFIWVAEARSCDAG